MTCAGQQQQCSVDRLPVFGDTNDRDIPSRDRFQAIVPAYIFQCSGRVTEWKACLFPSGIDDDLYYIQFQVWRSTGIEGCYQLVGYNIPLDADGNVVPNSVTIIDGVGLLRFGRENVPDRCVVLPVRESRQIEFQSGDVIGYYVDYFRDEGLMNNGGIQWIEDANNEVVVYYRDDLPRQDIKSQYAIGIDPSVCGFPNSNLYSLSNLASSAPIISLMSIGK